MLDLKEILAYFGLNKSEASVYLATLELGTAPASEIAKKAQIQRTYFYDLSPKLIKLGLLKEIREDKDKMFNAVKPEKLLKMQEQRLEKLKGALPKFKALENTIEQKPKIFYYEGPDGIVQINNDTLKPGGERVAFTTPSFFTKEQEKISNEHIKKRVAMGKKIRVIGEMTNEMIELKKRGKEELHEIRMLPKEIFHSGVEVRVYGNNVAVIDYKRDFGFIIEGTEFSKTLKMIFEIIWNSGRIIE